MAEQGRRYSTRYSTRVLNAGIQPGQSTRESLAASHAVPPGTRARAHFVVTLDHLHGLALSGGLGAQGAGGRKLVGRQPGAVVTPQAWAVGHLDRLPGLRIDGTSAPAVLDHELVGRAGV